MNTFLRTSCSDWKSFVISIGSSGLRGATVSPVAGRFSPNAAAFAFGVGPRRADRRGQAGVKKPAPDTSNCGVCRKMDKDHLIVLMRFPLSWCCLFSLLRRLFAPKAADVQVFLVNPSLALLGNGPSFQFSSHPQSTLEHLLSSKASRPFSSSSSKLPQVLCSVHG